MGCKLCRSVKNFGNEENYLSSSDSQLLSECHKDGEDSNSIRELLFSGFYPTLYIYIYIARLRTYALCPKIKPSGGRRQSEVTLNLAPIKLYSDVSSINYLVTLPSD